MAHKQEEVPGSVIPIGPAPMQLNAGLPTATFGQDCFSEIYETTFQLNEMVSNRLYLEERSIKPPLTYKRELGEHRRQGPVGDRRPLWRFLLVNRSGDAGPRERAARVRRHRPGSSE